MRILRVAICVMLIVGVLAMSLSTFAVDFGDRVVAQEYLWAYYLYQFLHSIGIDVTYQGIIQYTDEVQDTIIDWVVNYIADLIEADSQPSNFSISQWIAPWQADYDYWGNLQFNSTMLEDMQDFAEWLKSELSLIDDSVQVISPINTISGIPLFDYSKYYAVETIDGSPSGYLSLGFENNYASNFYPGYIAYSIYENGELKYYISAIQISGGTGSFSIWCYGYNTSGEYVRDHAGAFLTSSWSTYNIGKVQGPGQVGPYLPSNYKFSNYDYPVFQDNSEFVAFMQNAQIQVIGDISVITSEIVMPSDSPDYTQGDGVTIIDGVPNYQVINIDKVTVDNLPAIITQRNIPDIGNDEDNPGFSVPWQAINGLIQYVAVPAGAIMSIVNEAPVEGVIMLYALLGGIIIFGMIRVMREH